LGVRYDKATSRIIYIGSGVNLRKRVMQQRVSRHNAHLRMLRARYPEGMLATWFAIPGVPEEWLRAIEEESLLAAQRLFGCGPVCNMQAIESPLTPQCNGLVLVHTCEGLPLALSLDTIREQVMCKTI